MPYLQAMVGGGSSSLAGLSDVNITSPESGDTIIYDGTTSKWINMQGGTATVNIALTINGAKNDVITIKDSRDTTITTCTFESGSTQGTIRINVPIGGQSYKFISSVAKDTTTGTSDYAKTIFISDANNQTVNVYPKNALYWYGNNIDNMSNGTWSGVTLSTVTENTNNINFSASGSGYKYFWYCTQIKDLSRFSNVKIALSGSNAESSGCLIAHAPTKEMESITTLLSLNSYSHSTIEVKTMNITQSNGCIGIKFQMGQNINLDVSMHALWLDDGHEDYFTINGAKEDSITIKDSNNQTITTCNFDTCKTYGYVSKLLLPAGQSYKFVSSVAKDTIVGTSNYTKTIYIEGNESELNIMPNGSVYWYGNPIKPMTATGYTYNNYPNSGSITYGNNKINIASSGSGNIAVFGTEASINFTQFTKLKVFEISNADDGFGIRAATQKANIATDVLATISTVTSTSIKITSLDLSDINTNGYIALFVGLRTVTEMGCYAIWLENEFENAIKINGAKEDIIAIRDSNNQLVTTCVFSSGKTYGAVSKDLLPAGLYTFTSSIAKDTTTGTSDYSKVITLDGTEDTINVYPDHCYYWFGNEITEVTGGWYATRQINGATVTKNTNNIVLNCPQTSGMPNAYMETTNKCDFTGLTTLKLLNNNSRVSNDSTGMRGHWIHAGVDGAGAELANANSFVTGLNWLSSTITPSGDNLGYVNCHNWINYNYPATMTVYAVYAE